MYFSKLTGTGLASLTGQLRDITVDMRAAWLATAVLPMALTQPALTMLLASGNLVFRSGNDSLATYLHVYGRGGLAQSNSGGYSQRDASSLILHAYGQFLGLDPGYLSYARRTEVGQAAQHGRMGRAARVPDSATCLWRSNHGLPRNCYHPQNTVCAQRILPAGGSATYVAATNVHETTCNTIENHTALLVHQASVVQTQFLAALYPILRPACR
jgi:hypothetical protein